MQWQADAILLHITPYGDNHLIAHAFTNEYGCVAGLLQGGQSSRYKYRAYLQPTSLLTLQWTGRQSDALGRFDLDPVRLTCAPFLQEPAKLLSLQSMAALIKQAIPEKQPFPELYQASLTYLDHLTIDSWLALYIHWEKSFLASLGYGLSLDQCAVTGQKDSLIAVSPKTGRAVSAEPATPYLDKLLPLPAFLSKSDAPITQQDLQDGLRLTGYFLEHHVFANLNYPLPLIRQQFLDHLSNQNLANQNQETESEESKQ